MSNKDYVFIYDSREDREYFLRFPTWSARELIESGRDNDVISVSSESDVDEILSVSSEYDVDEIITVSSESDVDEIITVSSNSDVDEILSVSSESEVDEDSEEVLMRVDVPCHRSPTVYSISSESSSCKRGECYFGMCVNST